MNALPAVAKTGIVVFSYIAAILFAIGVVLDFLACPGKTVPLGSVRRGRQRGRLQYLPLPALVCAVVLRLNSASGNSSLWRSDMDKPAKNTICIWYDRDAEEAARFYARTFPDSSVRAVHLAPGDFPSGKKGQVLTVDFTVLGIPCVGLNGGPAFKHSEAFSFQVSTADQAETDRYWNAIVGNGGKESECGWCKDKWGLSWQITPAVLIKAVTDPDPAVAKRAFDAMMTMKKIDVAAIEAARRG
jgi:2-polyprenyl-6-hydroxyphenyl methylase/3-demethylubiquinone-9 3-methyltransferase